MLGEVGGHIQHAAVTMAHQAEAVVGHDSGHPGGFNPGIHFIPANRIVVQDTGDLMEGNARPIEDIGNFRHRACAAILQPFPGHGRAIRQPVKTRIVDGRFRA